MKNLKSIFLSVAVAAISFSTYAQDQQKSFINDHIGGNINLKTMHLWRGIEVAKEITSTTEIYFKTKNDVFRAGIWNGMGVNGNFKEFDYFAAFKHSGFEVSLWDIYNFSPDATYNNKEAFNYNARETGHFLDLRLSYRVQESFPIKIFWATVLYGRDRGELNDRNRYSSYIELEYPILSESGYTLDLGIGGAFALVKGKGLEGKKTKAHFYGDDPNVVDIHLRLSKIFKIGNYKLPISIMPMWNPEKDYMNAEVTMQLLSF